MTTKEEFGPQTLQSVVDLLFPAFAIPKSERTLKAITSCAFVLIANAIKREGAPVWNDDGKLEHYNLLVGPETYEDMRINLLLVGKSGSGKTSLMSGMELVNPHNAVFRKSGPNYDQMIGSTEKWQQGGTWHYEPFPGELASDMFLMDEVLSVYQEDDKDNKRVRELLRSALSRIGTNRITKPQVRVPVEHQINYYPECTLVQGFPDRVVPLHIITDGDLRRAHIMFVDFPMSEKKATRRFGTEEPPEGMGGRDEEAIAKAKRYLEWLGSHKYSFWIPPSTEGYVKKCMEELEEFAFPQGWKARHYFETAYMDIESRLYRFAICIATIRSPSSKVVSIGVDDVKQAMKYYGPAFVDSLLWVNNYTVGARTDLPGLKGRDVDRAEEVSRWLLAKCAVSFDESDVTPADLKTFMVSRGWFGSDAGTKRYYQSLLASAVVRSRKKGAKYVCWLGPIGNRLLSDEEMI